MLRLTEEQKRAAANSAGRAYIEAAPGSGKTTVAAERYGVIRYSSHRGGRGLLALSFARSARGELATRVQRRWGSGALTWPQQVSTLDGLHYRIISHLLATGEIEWLGGRTELTVLDTWRGQAGSRLLTPANKYCRVATLNGHKVATAGRQLGRHFYGYGNAAPHQARMAEGLSTHDEIRQVLYAALQDGKLRQSVAAFLTASTSALIVDEVFDGNGLDLEIVKLVAESGVATTLIGDPWQALYEFRGAEPELVPGLISDLAFEKYPLSQSFRFETAEMQDLASALRGGSPVSVGGGSAADVDVVLSSHWEPLWLASDGVLPLAFGQIGNRTEAALTLLLERFVSSRFGHLTRAGPEAALVLGLDPEAVRAEMAKIAERVLDRLEGGKESDAVASLKLLRTSLLSIGSRSIPRLPAEREAAKVEQLLWLSRRLWKPHLVPGMTIHQAKGREWDAVGVRLGPTYQSALATGLDQSRSADRAAYVALTRARKSVRSV